MILFRPWAVVFAAAAAAAAVSFARLYYFCIELFATLHVAYISGKIYIFFGYFPNISAACMPDFSRVHPSAKKEMKTVNLMWVLLWFSPSGEIYVNQQANDLHRFAVSESAR